MSKTTVNLEKESYRKLVILSAVKCETISEIINHLIDSDPKSKKILEVTKL